MINFAEFEVLKTCNAAAAADLAGLQLYYEQHMHHNEGLSLVQIAESWDGLRRKGCLQGFELTELGLAELEAGRVDNAVILAAGGAELNSKSVYSLPKGLFKVNGEVLIERQIRQLQEAGIKEIYVVLGVKQELYYYLADKFGVKLLINPCPGKNNIYSLYVAADKLRNSYICNCDNYFRDNPFCGYEYRSFHSTVHKADSSRELLVRKNRDGRITQVFPQAGGGECVYGHAFFSADFSECFRELLESEIDGFRIDALFWEEYVSKHICDLDIWAQPYAEGFVQEFDTIQEVQEIDSLFVENVSEQIIEIICRVLHCTKADIKGVEISEKGLTNILFTFEVFGDKYIFRYPGGSSGDIIYRRNEVCAQQLAYACGVDSTLVYIDEAGCKLCRYINDIRDLSDIYYKDIEFMKRLARSIRKIHDAGRELAGAAEYFLDPLAEADRLLEQAAATKGNLKERFADMRGQVQELFGYVEQDGVVKTICHNDINGDNCLLTDKSFDVIDWEFAGYNDPGFDFGRVLAGYDFADKEIDEILSAYFGRTATKLERLHWLAYVAIHNWYYVCWALYKESINESSRDWMLFFYEQVKRVLAYALPQYRELYGK